MQQYLMAYAASAIAFVGRDLVWLGVISTGFYRNQLGHLLRGRPDLTVAGVFHVVCIGGIVLFAISCAAGPPRSRSASCSGRSRTCDRTNAAVI